MIAVLAAGTAATTAWLVARRQPRRRPALWRSASRDPALAGGADQERGLLLRLRPALAALSFAAGWALVGGGLGIALGALLAALAWRVLGDVESPAIRRRRELLARQLPTGVQLLAAALRAGADVESAMSLVVHALPGPFADRLKVLGHELSLGVSPEQVWQRVSSDPQFGSLARTLGRAQETGAAVADVVDALAVELQGRRRAETERRAKSVDVQASAPLGVCFLPAFMVLGVVPLVAGIFGSLDILR